MDFFLRLYNKFETRPFSRRALFYFCFAAILFSILKAPKAFMPPQFWAEEAVVFYKQNLLFGTEALFKTYQSYIHLWPRLIALITAPVPIEWTPHVYKFFSILTHWLLCLLILFSRLGLSNFQKAVFILATALIPHGGEVFHNTANTITFCGLMNVILICQERAKSKTQDTIEHLLIFICGLSGAFILMLGPLFLIRLYWTDIKKAQWSRFIFVLITWLIQVANFSPGERGHFPVSSDLNGWKVGIYNIVRPLFYGTLPIKGLGLDILMLLTFYSLYKLLKPEIKKGINHWFTSLPLFFVMIGGAIYSASLVMFKHMPDAIHAFGSSQRLLYIPFICFLMTLLILPKPKEIKWEKIRILFLYLCIFSTALNFPSMMPYPDLKFQQQVQQWKNGEVQEIRVLPNWILRFGKDDPIIETF